MATIVFDFDGTIADSMPVIIEIYKEMLPGKHSLDSVEVNKLKRMPIQKVAGYLDISFWKAPFLLRRGRKLMHDRITSIEIFDGVVETLKQLKDRGYEMHIVSSNSTDNLNLFLNHHGLKSNFVEVKGISNLFGKTRAIKKLVKKHNLDTRETYYVGDEARDIISAKKAGLIMVSVTWGFNDAALLRDLHPDFIVDKPEELLNIFQQADTAA